MTKAEKFRRDKLYNYILCFQDNSCAICGKPPKKKRLAMDHDHKTGMIRGLACWRCNNFLIGQHTVETAKKVYEYLKSARDWGVYVQK